MFNSKLIRVLFAGMWFAVAAIIPIIYVFACFNEVSSLFGDSLNMTVTFPILLSGICGSLLGTSIFDAEEIKNALEAMLRGLLIAVLSYLLMFTLPTIILALYTPDFFSLIVYSFFLFVYGLLFVGWLAGAVGVVAGLLLYLIQLNFLKGDKI